MPGELHQRGDVPVVPSVVGSAETLIADCWVITHEVPMTAGADAQKRDWCVGSECDLQPSTAGSICARAFKREREACSVVRPVVADYVAYPCWRGGCSLGAGAFLCSQFWGCGTADQGGPDFRFCNGVARLAAFGRCDLGGGFWRDGSSAQCGADLGLVLCGMPHAYIVTDGVA